MTAIDPVDAPTASATADPAPAQQANAAAAPRLLVIDTNVVLDLFLFQDPRTPELARAIRAGELRWLATPRMREECKRVLAYPHLQGVAAQKSVDPATVLAQFDALSTPAEPAEPARLRCKDVDDQCFIDLAVAHRATLISKDRHVLKLRKGLKRCEVTVLQQWPEALASA